MTSLTRALSFPGNGYGPEPRTVDDVLVMTAAQITSVLTQGWTVSASRTASGLSPEDDGELLLLRDELAVASFTLNLKNRALTKRDIYALGAATTGLSDSTLRRIVVSRYLSAPAREELRSQGMSFADATGNILLTSPSPLIHVSAQGAAQDPWRGPGRPKTSLKGNPAALLVRALVDFAPPYTIPQIARASGASLGAAYRLADYLLDERLIERPKRGPITEVDWAALLRRWGSDRSYLDDSTTWSFLEPRGLNTLREKLSKLSKETLYAVTGSLAAEPYAPYADARLALLYSPDPQKLADAIGLRPVDTGANVLISSPRSPVVFERMSDLDATMTVAPSQAAADLLGGPGRNPAEGEYLLEWMERNESEWRYKLDD